jgi:hypothetical protein
MVLTKLYNVYALFFLSIGIITHYPKPDIKSRQENCRFSPIPLLNANLKVVDKL